MELQKYNDYDQLSFAVAHEMIQLITQKPAALICVATGNTPVGPYKKFIELATKIKLDYSQVRFVGLDEWVGLSPDNEGTCYHFLHKHLFNPLGIPSSQYRLFNGLAENLENECVEMEGFLAEQGPIDLMLLGIGMNGHLGFNEPGTPWHLKTQVIDLDETTQQVGQQYFAKAMSLKRGITLGPATIQSSKKVLMMANGTHKRPILEKMLNNDPTVELPASLLKTLDQAVVMTDSLREEMS